MTLKPPTVALHKSPFSIESGHVTKEDSGFQKTEDKPVEYQFTE